MMLASLASYAALRGSSPYLQRVTTKPARVRMAASDASLFKPIDGFQAINWPEEFPFKDDKFFARADESPDILCEREEMQSPCAPPRLCSLSSSASAAVYQEPRFVTHIDDSAIKSLSEYYAHVIPPGADVLDLCSSWISHFPDSLELGRVAGLGMNEAELSRNKRLTERTAQACSCLSCIWVPYGKFL